MKKFLNKTLIALLALAITPQAQAYIYSFTNHTKNPVSIGMKYKGSSQLEFIVIKPNERQQFQPGTAGIAGVKTGIGSGKSGYVASLWYYLINPPYMSDANKNNVPWRALNFTWLETDQYKVALEAAEAIGNLAETATKAGMKAGAAYMTSGASVAADAAAEAVKKAAQKAAKAETLKEVASSDYSLGKFIASVGKLVGHSMMRSFHTDIIEDEDGKIQFITLL